MLFTISKINLFNFLEDLAKSMPLYAPIKEKGIVQFVKVTDPKLIDLKEQSYYPIKHFFRPPKEVLFTFDNNSIKQPKLHKHQRAFFGVRRCDLTALARQELVFYGTDPLFTAERDRSLLLGYHCFKPLHEHCFCSDFNMVDNFDMMFYDEGEFLIAETATRKGEALAQNYPKYFKARPGSVTAEEKKIPTTKHLLTKEISPLYDNPRWFEAVSLCLSCSACTVTCPTCYCFSLRDEVQLSDPKKGQRIREWSSCQLENFTKVAGNHVFRKDRDDRFKHRIYHQLVYFKEEHNEILCVGCGRCIRACPTRIDWVKTINNMMNK